MTNETQWVLVPADALRWLNGEHDDGFDRPEGMQGAFWWRTEFRRRCEASPSPPAGGGEAVALKWRHVDVEQYEARSKFGTYEVCDHRWSFEPSLKRAVGETGSLADAKQAAQAHHVTLTSPDAAQQRIRDLEEALRAVISATGAYLPPDGISKDECINRILEATDNPKINAIMMGGHNGSP